MNEDAPLDPLRLDDVEGLPPPGPTNVKALTLTQPWASLVAIGAKRIETRSWGTSYRGPLAIHAAKTVRGMDIGNLVWDDPAFGAALAPLIEQGEGSADPFSPDEHTLRFCENTVNEKTGERGWRRLDLPVGAIVAVTDLADVVPTGSGRIAALLERRCEVYRDKDTDRVRTVGQFEQELGDYTPGRYAWILDNVSALERPLPCRGWQGLWDVPPELAARWRP